MRTCLLPGCISMNKKLKVVLVDRVANLAFLKPDFEILAFLAHLAFYEKKSQRNLERSGVLFVGKAWL